MGGSRKGRDTSNVGAGSPHWYLLRKECLLFSWVLAFEEVFASCDQSLLQQNLGVYSRGSGIGRGKDVGFSWWVDFVRVDFVRVVSPKKSQSLTPSLSGPGGPKPLFPHVTDGRGIDFSEGPRGIRLSLERRRVSVGRGRRVVRRRREWRVGRAVVWSVTRWTTLPVWSRRFQEVPTLT